LGLKRSHEREGREKQSDLEVEGDVFGKGGNQGNVLLVKEKTKKQ